MGVPLRKLYGQTELLGAYTLHPRRRRRLRTRVGVPMADDIEIRIDNPDDNGVGEIVARHPNMFVGYYKNRGGHRAPTSRDGWMHYRRRRLLQRRRAPRRHRPHQGSRRRPRAASASRRNIIENKLKFSPYVAEAVVLGAGRDYLAAIICIRFSIVSKWAEKNRISFTTYTDLSARPEVYALLRKEVESVNATLPRGAAHLAASCCSTRSSTPTTAS